MHEDPDITGELQSRGMHTYQAVRLTPSVVGLHSIAGLGTFARDDLLERIRLEDPRNPDELLDLLDRMESEEGGPANTPRRRMVAARLAARAQRPVTEVATLLAQAFPSLRKAPGVDPWDADALWRYTRSGAPGSGARHAGRFVLGVWNWTGPWRPFDVLDAMSSWDESHRTAFLAWAASPFWL